MASAPVEGGQGARGFAPARRFAVQQEVLDRRKSQVSGDTRRHSQLHHAVLRGIVEIIDDCRALQPGQVFDALQILPHRGREFQAHVPQQLADEFRIVAVGDYAQHGRGRTRIVEVAQQQPHRAALFALRKHLDRNQKTYVVRILQYLVQNGVFAVGQK